MLPAPWRIDEVRPEISDTFTLFLSPLNPGTRRSFAPGQFNMLYVFGVGEIPISICSDPSNRNEGLQHTTRAVGTVSRAMQKLVVGDVIGVRGPFGSHWPMAEAQGRDVVLVAGGIGLAPLRSVVLEMLSRRDDFGRVVLLYGARTPEDILYQDELNAWRTEQGIDVFVSVDRVVGDWEGDVGVVTSLISRAPFNPQNTIAFCCGPEVMMRFTSQELEKRGVRADRQFISMERNMKCAVGFCGHCQFGPSFVCRDGPVFRYDQMKPLLTLREI
jgi:NAD(P)H-flavin reductase